MQQPVEAPGLEVKIGPPQSQADYLAFQSLNEEWITRSFVMEDKDRETLANPQEQILNKGGRIFMVYVDRAPVGCAALIPMDNGVYELSKMAVTEALRGRGVGRQLLEHTIAEARKLGAKALFLGSNTTLKNAVHLYESVGFQHIQPERVPPTPYTRANVFMEMIL